MIHETCIAYSNGSMRKTMSNDFVLLHKFPMSESMKIWKKADTNTHTATAIVSQAAGGME